MTGGSTGSGSGTGDVTTDGSDSVAGGNQVLTPVELPIVVGGNAVSGVGDSTTSDAGVTGGSTGSGSGAGDVTTDGSDSVAGGNQVLAPIGLPITVGGNAVSGIGDSSTDDADTTGGSTTGTGAGDIATDGTDSIGGGNQVSPRSACPSPSAETPSRASGTATPRTPPPPAAPPAASVT